MKPRSNTLFHFTKSAEILKLILSNGFWPKYCLEDVGWLQYEEFSYVAYPMVCFCDIPLSRISEHVEFYGGYGVGLTRGWVDKNELNPVFYISDNDSIRQVFRKFNSLANEKLNEGVASNLRDNLRSLLTYTKPMAGVMVADGEKKNKEFYQESEWRYILKNSEIKTYMTEDVFNNNYARSESDSVSKSKFMLKFSPSDIRYIFVALDEDVPNMVDYIYQVMEHVSEGERKLLMSRIVSLESISSDI